MARCTDKPDGYMSIFELSEKWHASERTIKDFISEGMPCLQVGNCRYLKLEECQKWYRQYAW